MSLKLSYPERTNLYLTNTENISKIEIFNPLILRQKFIYKFN